MSHAAHISLDAGTRLAQGLALSAMVVTDFADGLQRRREAAVDSVHELAIRLQESRRAEAAAKRRAATAEQELVDALTEVQLLREALRNEKTLSAGLRQILGV